MTNSPEKHGSAANGSENAASGGVALSGLASGYAWDDPEFKENPTAKENFRLSVNIAHDLGINGKLYADTIEKLTQLGAVRSLTPDNKPLGRTQTNPDNPTGTITRGHGFFMPPRVALAGQCDHESDVMAAIEQHTVDPDGFEAVTDELFQPVDAGGALSEVPAFVERGEDGQVLERERGQYVGTDAALVSSLNFVDEVATVEPTTTPPETPKAEEFPEFGSVDLSRVVGGVVGLAVTVKPPYLLGCNPAIGAAVNRVLGLGGSETLVAAVSYASIGLRSFPLVAGGKTPAVAGGFKVATSEISQLVNWFDDGEFFQRSPHHDKNLGIATGETDGDFDLVVLDVDVKDGKDGGVVIQSLEAELGKLPVTLMASTPSGGLHYLYKAPKGSGIGCSVDVFKQHGEGLDIRCNGGYIAASPSEVNGKPYQWLNDLLPAWFPDSWITGLQAECPVGGKRGAVSGSGSGDGERVTRGELLPMPEDVESAIAEHAVPSDVERTDWLKVLSVLSGFAGGDALARQWSSTGNYAKRFNDADFDTAWDEVHSGFNDGVPMREGVLFNLVKEHSPEWQTPAVRRKLEQEAANVEASKKQTAALLSAATGADAADKPQFLAGVGAAVEPVPSLEDLRKRINDDGAKSWDAYEAEGFSLNDGGKWLAWGLVHGDESKATTYQTEHPTVTNDNGEQTLRKLAPGGVVNWENYTYVASMHIAGVVLLMMGKPPGFKATDLGKATQEAVTRLVNDLLDSSPVAAVWNRLNSSDPKMILWNTVRAGVKAATVKGKANSKPPAVVDKRLAPTLVQLVNTPPVPAVVMPVLGQMPAFLQPGATPSPLVAEENTTIVTVEPVGSVDEVGKETPADRLYRLAKRAFRREWVYDPVVKAIYTPNGTGTYRQLDDTAVKREITRLKDTYDVKIRGKGDIESAASLLTWHLDAVEWSAARHLLPFRNIVLDIETREKLPYELCPKFNWQLPYVFDTAAACPVFDAFIHKAVGHDAGIVQTLRAFMRCLVEGAYTVKKYLEAVGPSDSGKTQFMNICIALVGKENTVLSDFQSLEGSSTARFETRSFYGRRLAVFPDEEKFYGGSRVFRNLTGGDLLRNEGKIVNKGEAFIFEGLAIVTANDFMNPKNAGGAIMKRRIPVMFPTSATPEEMAMYPDGIANYIAANEMPGVMNWVLAMPLEEAKAIMRNPDAKTKALNDKVEHDNNVVLAWMTDNVSRCARGEETPVGKDNSKSQAMVMPTGYTTGQQNPNHGLYADFCEYCRGVGQSPANRSNFIKNVETVCKQRNIPYEYGKETKRNQNRNNWIMLGFKLRRGEEPSIFD